MRNHQQQFAKEGPVPLQRALEFLKQNKRSKFDETVEIHMALGVENMDTTQVALEKTGWQPHGEEHKQMGKDGKYQLNVFDPDDVRIEFMNFTPSEKPCCAEFTGEHPKP